jgi:hypothetical protein
MSTPDELSCTLSERDLAQQSKVWHEQRPFILSHDRSDGRFRITFDRARHDRLDALVATERGCCSWAQWSLSDDATGSVLEVTGPPAEIAALADAFGL